MFKYPGATQNTLIKLKDALITVFFLILSAVIVPKAWAQGLEDAEFRTWIDITVGHEYNDKWRFNIDTGIRGLLSTREWTTIYARPTFIYQPKRWFDVRGGLSCFYTFFQGTDVSNLTELRLHQEANLRWPKGTKFTLDHMFRFEERWFFARDEDSRFSARFRYRPTVTTPDFQVFKMERPFYVFFSADFFFPVAGTFNNFFSNNYRLILGIGNRHSDKLRWEIHYFWQRSRINISESFGLSDHIIRLRFFI